MAATTGLAWYVYGLVDPAPPSPRGGIEGTVDVLREGSLAALVSRVPLAEYGDDVVRARLEDPAWLEEKVRAHEEVLDGALGAGAVLPFRFLTLYRDEDELRRFLRSREEDFRSVLDSVRGKVELGVKAFAGRDAGPGTTTLRELDDEIAGASAGKAYLLRRRRDQLAEEERARFRLECARTCHARLSAAAEAATSNPPQPRELSGREDEMILNGAYLVPAGDAALTQAVADLDEEYGPLGVDFELTGPWPPYNFVPRELGT